MRSQACIVRLRMHVQSCAVLQMFCNMAARLSVVNVAGKLDCVQTAARVLPRELSP